MSLSTLQTNLERFKTGAVRTAPIPSITPPFAAESLGVQDNNATALKIFIELVNKESYKANTINNFIQINNLRLGNEDFQKLPKETLDKIEELISKQIYIYMILNQIFMADRFY